MICGAFGVFFRLYLQAHDVLKIVPSKKCTLDNQEECGKGGLGWMGERMMECPGLFVQCPVVDAAHISENPKYVFGRSNLRGQKEEERQDKVFQQSLKKASPPLMSDAGFFGWNE